MNWVCQIARFHDVWVITRANNFQQILPRAPMPNVRWIFLDLPGWARFWKKKRREFACSLPWQLGAYLRARQLHRRGLRFSAPRYAQVIYWMPSFMALLPIPLLWGPVGGGDSMPLSFWRNLSLRGKVYESLRAIAQQLSSWDPFLRLTARRLRWH